MRMHIRARHRARFCSLTGEVSFGGSRSDAPNQRSSQRLGAAHGDARKRSNQLHLFAAMECVRRNAPPADTNGEISETDCVAGHVGLELRNPCASHVFE